MEKESQKLIKEFRRLFADYYSSEGCSCCRGSNHGEHLEKIAEFLDIPKHSDNSGYNVMKYISKKNK